MTRRTVTLNNFCVLPFNSISISADGKIRQCCNSGGLEFNTFVDSAPVETFINNTDLINLRKSFINDLQDSKCNRCWDIEKRGSKSFRHWANEEEDFGLNSVIPIIKQDVISFEDIQYFDITLGNKCNLACRMCNPTSSSLLAKQLKIVKEWDGQEFIEFSQDTRNKILDFINKSTNLNTIYMLGGEPLVNDFHDEIVELLIKTDRAKKIKLSYNTNLQIDIEKYLNMWARFRKIECSISIDGSKNIYEYIRWPGKWSKVFNNILQLKEYRKEYSNFNPGIHMTVQNLNAANIYDTILETCVIPDNPLNFFFIPVTGIPNLGSNDLWMYPTDVLIKELEKLNTLDEPYARQINSLKSYYKDAITKSQSLNQHSVEQFFKTQKMFDNLRGQNLFATINNFEELADKFGITKW